MVGSCGELSGPIYGCGVGVGIVGEEVLCSWECRCEDGLFGDDECWCAC